MSSDHKGLLAVAMVQQQCHWQHQMPGLAHHQALQVVQQATAGLLIHLLSLGMAVTVVPRRMTLGALLGCRQHPAVQLSSSQQLQGQILGTRWFPGRE